MRWLLRPICWMLGHRLAVGIIWRGSTESAEKEFGFTMCEKSYECFRCGVKWKEVF